MLKYFLGVEVMRSKQGIMLSQQKYALDMLFEIGNLGVKPCSTPMAPNVQLTKEGELFEDPERYRRLIGKLNYLVISHSQSLGNCREYPMLFERSSWTWNIV